MTIDETIENLKYDNEIDMYIRDIAPQLAEWLELLKWYQQGMGDIPSESGVLPKDVYRAGYTKAIYDFAEALKEKYEEHNFDLCLRQNNYYSYSNSCMLFESYIDRIAEQIRGNE